MRRLTLFILLLFSVEVINSQVVLKDSDIKDYESQIEQMIRYLQETLNFIGDPANSTHEKDIIFKESYTKIFKDENVQIEDDLDETRDVSINKDVQSYLKDIDFFFDDVTFTFDVQVCAEIGMRLNYGYKYSNRNTGLRNTYLAAFVDYSVYTTRLTIPLTVGVKLTWLLQINPDNCRCLR